MEDKKTFSEWIQNPQDERKKLKQREAELMEKRQADEKKRADDEKARKKKDDDDLMLIILSCF